MGSTILTGATAYAIRVDKPGRPRHGKILYAIGYEGYESNVFPQTRRWSLCGIGDLEATLAKIFAIASECEGGMVRGPRYRYTAETVIAKFMKAMAQPRQVPGHQTVVLPADSGSRQGTPPDQPPRQTVIAEFLEQRGYGDHAARARQGNEVTVDTRADFDVIVDFVEMGFADPWSAFRATGPSPSDPAPDPDLGYQPKQRKSSATTHELPDKLWFLETRQWQRYLFGQDTVVERNTPQPGPWVGLGLDWEVNEAMVQRLGPQEFRHPGSWKPSLAAWRHLVTDAIPLDPETVVSAFKPKTNVTREWTIATMSQEDRDALAFGHRPQHVSARSPMTDTVAPAAAIQVKEISALPA